MKVVKLLAPAAIVVIMLCAGTAPASGKSAAKEWNFKMEKVWEIQQIGDDKLLRPAEPRVADDGTLYFRDFERNLSYIIDPGGKPVTSFAPQGAKEGEVSYYFNCFPADNNVVICAPDKLHFFSKEGKFVKAVPNNLFVRFPLAFKNENEFWVAPGALGDSPGGKATVTHVNLASNQETAVHEFVLSDEEKKPSGGGVIIGLTPQALMSFDRRADRIYFGKNSDTVIYRLPADGGMVSSFSFTGTRQPVTETDKRNHFAKHKIPEDRVAKIIPMLPNQMTYYDKMQVVDSLLYLFVAETIGSAQTFQEVNVFSLEGRHLYHGRIQVENGWHIFSNPNNLQVYRGFVYAVQENDTGDKKIVKYKVTLP